MARKFDAIEEWETYVPLCERQCFAKTPNEAFTVEVRYLSARERRQLDTKIMVAAASDASDAHAVAERAAKGIFCSNVRNVRNYAPNGTPIETAEAFFDQGEADMVNEVEAAMRNRQVLDGGLAKKLRPPSAS